MPTPVPAVEHAIADPQSAAARGVPTTAVSLAFMLLLGLIVAVAVHIIGALLVMALLVTPAAAAMVCASCRASRTARVRAWSSDGAGSARKKLRLETLLAPAPSAAFANGLAIGVRYCVLPALPGSVAFAPRPSRTRDSGPAIGVVPAFRVVTTCW